MTARDLIEVLRTLPPQTEVYVWLDGGDRLTIESLDDSVEFVEQGFADLMVKEQ